MDKLSETLSPDLTEGTVTFLFTDIAGSKRLGPLKQKPNGLSPNIPRIILTRMLRLAALFLADRGEVERAFVLYESACQHPFVAISQWYIDVVGKRIDERARGLPTDIAEAARHRGRERDPRDTIEKLLAELGAEEKEKS